MRELVGLAKKSRGPFIAEVLNELRPDRQG